MGGERSQEAPIHNTSFYSAHQKCQEHPILSFYSQSFDPANKALIYTAVLGCVCIYVKTGLVLMYRTICQNR